MPHHLGLPSHYSLPCSLSHMFRDGRDSQLCSMPPLHQLVARSGCFAHAPVMLLAIGPRADDARPPPSGDHRHGMPGPVCHAPHNHRETSADTPICCTLMYLYPTPYPTAFYSTSISRREIVQSILGGLPYQRAKRLDRIVAATRVAARTLRLGDHL